MACLQPRLESLRRERNRIGRGDPDNIEADLLGAFDEGALERLAI